MEKNLNEMTVKELRTLRTEIKHEIAMKRVSKEVEKKHVNMCKVFTNAIMRATRAERKKELTQRQSARLQKLEKSRQAALDLCKRAMSHKQ